LKNHVLANLDYYLERFEDNVVKSGGRVHWCATAAEARDTVLRICREAGARSVTKGKSMIGEEIALNDHLEANGIRAVRKLDEPREILDEARAMLRRSFFSAEVGITGANFLVAETGSTVIVTNEGNGDLTQTLAGTHIVLASIERPSRRAPGARATSTGRRRSMSCFSTTGGASFSAGNSAKSCAASAAARARAFVPSMGRSAGMPTAGSMPGRSARC
jgi:L-lactate utilization protein LutB